MTGANATTDDAQLPAVDAENLSLTYADGTQAVRDVSLTIERGECFGFLGPNGAGKTTTIKMLATLLDPTSGTVRVNGYDAASERASVRATIGYMAQETTVDAELTARENLLFACEAYGVPRNERATRIDDLLELVDLADVGDTPAEQFSGGMQKRLDAATALVHDPELVFLDEPTTGLDPKARNRLWEYFERINDDGTTIFLTTQYLEEADALCERLAVIRDGEIVANGTPSSLKRRLGGPVLEVDVNGGPQRTETAAEVLRSGGVLAAGESVDTTDDSLRVQTQTPQRRATDVVLALRDADIGATGFDIAEPTLDDVFLAIADETLDDDTDTQRQRVEVTA